MSIEHVWYQSVFGKMSKPGSWECLYAQNVLLRQLLFTMLLELLWSGPNYRVERLICRLVESLSKLAAIYKPSIWLTFRFNFFLIYDKALKSLSTIEYAMWSTANRKKITKTGHPSMMVIVLNLFITYKSLRRKTFILYSSQYFCVAVPKHLEFRAGR